MAKLSCAPWQMKFRGSLIVNQATRQQNQGNQALHKVQPLRSNKRQVVVAAAVAVTTFKQLSHAAIFHILLCWPDNENAS